jgi:acyl-ACP thioesterase
MPKWEDSIILKTWPNGTDKLFALRNFEVTFPVGRRIVSATSSWLILDRTTKKVQRPDSILSEFYSDLNPNKSPIRYASKIETAGDDGISSQPYKIKVSDVDINLHTNNVKYLTWVSDCYGLDFVMQNVPMSAEINYLAESQFNENVVIKTSAEETNGLHFNHSVRRIEDNRELCRIKIGWRETNSK